jgi:hypothetical protein
MTIINHRPPADLKHIQYWFAGVITQRIDEQNAINPIAPSGTPIAVEAKQYIAPSPTLTSSQRIEIYNQQYWWRLLNVLQEDFPFLLNLFGYRDFNQNIAFPYLERYPPQHWSLNILGQRLPLWIKRYYQGQDKEIVYIAASIDATFQRSFVAIHHTAIQPNDLSDDESFLSRKLYMQPHIFEFRERILEQTPEYWLEHDFPELPRQKPLAFMVWRDAEDTVGWIPLNHVEYLLLKKFKIGCSLSELCEWLERQKPSVYKVAAEHLQEWTQRWTVNEWLTFQK